MVPPPTAFRPSLVRCATAVFLVCSACSALLGQDTALVRFLQFPEPIISMAHDGKGHIWFNTRFMLYAFDGERITPLKRLEERQTLVFKDQALNSLEKLRAKGMPNIGAQTWQDNQIWAHYLPKSGRNIYAAPDKKGIIWVTAGQHLFGFKPERNFHRALQGHSLRGILGHGADLVIGSYSGLFRNGVLVTGDSVYTNGNLLGISPQEILVPSIALIRYNPLTHQSEYIPFPKESALEQAHADCLLQARGQTWVGSSVGLFRLQGDSLVKDALRLAVEYLSTDEDALYIATEKGIFRYSPDGCQQLSQFPEQVFNFIEKIGDAWWAASERGIWYWKGDHTPAKPLFPGEPLAQTETYAVLQDKAGYFWASSVGGLYRFRPELGYYEHYLHKLEFNKRSFAVIRDTFYFGGTNGLVSFDPLTFSPMPAVSTPSQKLAGQYLAVGLLALLLSTAFFLYRKWKNAEQILKSAYTPPSPEAPTPTPNTLTAKLEQHVLQNINTVTVESLSTFSGMSERTLYRLLRETYAITPGDLIREVKIKRIKELTAQRPGLSREELARMVGYSPTNLSRILNDLDKQGQANTDNTKGTTIQARSTTAPSDG
jgi:AraC-like DNA-binding protein